MTPTQQLANTYIKRIRRVCEECSIAELHASDNKLDMDRAYQKSQIRIERTLNNYFFKRRNILESYKKTPDEDLLETHNVKVV